MPKLSERPQLREVSLSDIILLINNQDSWVTFSLISE